MRRRGAVLLEVLISLALMVFGLAVVGLRVSTSLDSARRSQLWTTAIVLTESKMAELQAGAVAFKPTDEQIGGYFGIRYPGYSWQIEIEPCEIDDLYLMTLRIGYNPEVIQAQIDNPDLELDFEDEGVRIVRTVHRLVPKPADLDLNRDLGIPLDDLQPPGGEGGEEGEEGGSAAGGELWALINEFLTKHPEILNESGGIDLEAVKNLPAEDFQMAMEILQQFVGRGSQLGQLQEQLGENLEGAGQSGRGSSGRGGRGGQSNQGGDRTQGNTGGQDGGDARPGRGDAGRNQDQPDGGGRNNDRRDRDRPGRNDNRADQDQDNDADRPNRSNNNNRQNPRR